MPENKIGLIWRGLYLDYMDAAEAEFWRENILPFGYGIVYDPWAPKFAVPEQDV